MKTSTWLIACGSIASLVMAAGTFACGEAGAPEDSSAAALEKGTDEDRVPSAEAQPQSTRCPESACAAERPTCESGQTAQDLVCMRDWAHDHERAWAYFADGGKADEGSCSWALHCVTYEDGCTAADCSAKYGERCDGGALEDVRCVRDPGGRCGWSYQCR